jgi:uncharacterized membrane protein YeaQ/YmgE (transglycosylase-associated protein family)
MEQKNKCCETGKDSEERKPNGLLEGIIYGLIPHTGCIAFVLFAIVGATAMSALFQPLLMNRNLFYGLILLSFAFATLSATIYLNKRGLLSAQGIARAKGYLSVLYGTTIGVNLLFFFVIFPILANAIPAPSASVSAAASLCPLNATSECQIPATAQPQPAVQTTPSTLTIRVDIPCSGHAPLIESELYKLNGVKNVKFTPANQFAVSYDSTVTTKDGILNLGIFKTYPATEIGG